MKIYEPTKKLVTYGEIRTGNLFWYEKALCMRLDKINQSVKVENGITFGLGGDTMVEPEDDYILAPECLVKDFVEPENDEDGGFGF